jgi:hypothetical protein
VIKLFSAVLLLFVTGINAQELFVVTDPASNVPAGSLGIRLGQSIKKKTNGVRVQLPHVDVVPSVQFIINSQARIDLAYRYELYSAILGTTPNGAYLNRKYNFFNILKLNKVA